MSFKAIRITLLLLVLIYVGFDRLYSNARATDWKHPLRVVIYPINGDGSDASAKEISSLNLKQFDDIEIMLKKEATRYGLNLANPIYLQIADELKSIPPAIPKERSLLNVMRWSLTIRYWAWKEDNFAGVTPQIRVYVLFYDPKTHKGLAHSTGLENAKIALVKLFADDKRKRKNNVVLLHELLHTLGATDKYNLQNNNPIHPYGYAEPNRKPLYPQKSAEIMGGRIPLSSSKAVIPSSLTKTIIGPKTAQEIGWLKN